VVQFYKTPSLLKYISKHLIWGLPTSEKCIYLTFDDGPIPHLTEYVLDVLDEFDAKATFFCVGDNIFKYPEVCKKVIQRGNILGNHTYNHLKGWSTGNQEYIDNIDKCQQIIEKYQKMSKKPLLRPPHGQISLNQINLLKEKYSIIMWDILAYDFDDGDTPKKSLERIIRLTKPGSIVVFHDNYKTEAKLKYMLPRYLRSLKGKGFSFKILDPK